LQYCDSSYHFHAMLIYLAVDGTKVRLDGRHLASY
jgi:hypothetical protein